MFLHQFPGRTERRIFSAETSYMPLKPLRIPVSQRHITSLRRSRPLIHTVLGAACRQSPISDMPPSHGGWR